MSWYAVDYLDSKNSIGKAIILANSPYDAKYKVLNSSFYNPDGDLKIISVNKTYEEW